MYFEHKADTNVSDFYVSDRNLRIRQYGELISEKIDKSPSKEGLLVDNLMPGTVKLRLRSRRGALSDFFIWFIRWNRL